MSSFDPARVLVIGAGVNGSVCASALAGAGLDVTLLARGARVAQLRQQGIEIEDPFSGVRTARMVPVLAHLEPGDVYDFVLVTVRKNQLAALLPMLEHNRSPNVVFMGNNLGGPAPLIAALGARRVMLGFVFAAGKRDGPLVRALASKRMSAPFGELDGRVTPRLRRLVALLQRAGLNARIERHIVDWQATHAIGVALIAALVMRYGGDVKALAQDPGALTTMIEARREAFHALRSLGRRVVPFTEGVFNAVPKVVQAGFYRALLESSLGEVGLAWHVSQAPDEMLALGEELETLIAEAKIPAPAVDRVLHGSPPPMTRRPVPA